MAIEVSISLKDITGGSENVPLVEVRPYFEYTADQKRGRQIGTLYTILILKNGCSKLGVKIETINASVTQEELDKRNEKMDFLMVSFDGYSAKPYIDRNGQIQYSSKANQIRLTNNNSGTGATK